MSRSSAGGSGAAGGVTHEARCLAWGAAHLLTEVPLPTWASGRRVTAVGGQTERAVDDVAFVTDEGGWVLVQAKKGLQLARSESSPLAEALEQLVRAQSEGVPDRPVSSATRELEPGRDCVLILSDAAASRPVDPHLREVTERLRVLPEWVPVAEAARSGGEQSALEVLRFQLERIWYGRQQSPLTESDLRALGKLLGVRRMNLLDDGADYLAVAGLLARISSSEDEIRRVWGFLQLEGLRLAEDRTFIGRAGLIRRLEAEGIVLDPATRLRSDIDRLRARTRGNMDLLASALAIRAPDGEVKVRRVVESTIRSADGNLAIIGDAGAGKSSLLHGLAVRQQDESRDVVVLLANDLRGSSGQTRSELNLDNELADVLLGWSGSAEATLMIDGLDQTRGFDASAWLAQLAVSIGESRWRIIATIRTYDIRHCSRWRRMFKGPAVSSDLAASDLSGVRHLLVGDLGDSELAEIASASPMLSRLLDTADVRLRRLLANPYNLSLAALLLDDPDVDLTRARGRIDLLDVYWQRRVDDEDGLDRRRALQVIVAKMIAAGRQNISPADLPAQVTSEAVEGLRRTGVLRGLPPRPGQGFAPVEFSHPVLFDYAGALFGLGDTSQPLGLLNALNENPNLVLTVRPSLEYRLTTIWRDDDERNAFWNLALHFADSAAGHPLAMVAAGRTAVIEIQSSSDLGPLVEACTGPHASSTDDAYTLTYLVAAAAGRASGASESHNALSEAATRLAAHALHADDVTLAMLAAQISLRLLSDQPQTLSAYMDFWRKVAVAVTTVALADLGDPRREALARPMGNLLGLVAQVDAKAVAAPVREVIRAEVFDAWGAMHVWSLIDHLPSIVRGSPEVALALAAAVWGYDDKRDIVTTMNNSSILGMTSNRHQDLEGLRYHVGTRFTEIARADLQAGTDLLLSALDLSENYRWPASEQFANPPRPRLGDDLQYSAGHHVLLPMVTSWIDLIRNFAESVDATGNESEKLERLIGKVVDGLRHSEVWHRLLQAAVDAEEGPLADALWPALQSPNLFAFDMTWVPAAHLARRLSLTLSDSDRAALEDAISGLIDAAQVTEESSKRRLQVLTERRRLIRASLDLGRPSAADVNQAGSEEIAEELPDIGEASLTFVHWDSESPEEGTVDDLRHKLTEAQKLSESPEITDRERAVVELLALWTTINSLEEGSVGFEGVDAELRTDVAHRLARLRVLTPTSDAGRSVYDCLVAALPDFDNPPAGDEPHESWGRHVVWGSTPTTNALQGLISLVRRQGWRDSDGEELSGRLRPFVDCGNPLYRFLLVRALPDLYLNAVDLQAVLRERLTVEQDLHVVGRLVSLLGQLMANEAADSDQLLAHVLDERGWTASNTALDSEEGTVARPTLSLLARLAIIDDAERACGLLGQWFATPLDYPERVKLIASWMRSFMNPVGAEAGVAQRKVFELLALSADVIAAEWTRSRTLAPNEVSEDGQRLAEIVKVADAIATQLYFASGAFEAKRGDADPAVTQDRFCDLALPLLKTLGEVNHPKVTHHLVETLDHLSVSRPRESLLAVAEALSLGGGYSQESLGLGATLTLARRYLTEHREMLRDDADCLSAVRSLLEVFVRAGWDEAMKLTEELDELFN